MAQGAFIVAEHPDHPGQIRFQVAPNGPDPLPDDQVALQAQIAQAEGVLRALYPMHGPEEENPRFREALRALVGIAQVGLVGDRARPDLATRALADLKVSVVRRESGPVKNRYMRTLGRASLTWGLPALALGAGLQIWAPPAALVASFLFLWAGCAAGVWLSFGVRKAVLDFEELQVIEEDGLPPSIRVVFAGLLTLVLGLLFSTGALNVTVGQVSASGFTSSWQVALLIGVLCGVGEQMLSSRVLAQAKNLLSPGPS